MKAIVHSVTPEEYDSAVAHDPHCSIFTATGDNRPGSQLVDNAGTDLHCSIEAMAANPAGLSVLDCLSAATEAFACVGHDQRQPFGS